MKSKHRNCFEKMLLMSNKSKQKVKMVETADVIKHQHKTEKKFSQIEQNFLKFL